MKPRPLNIFFLLLVLSPTILSAQEIITISGKIIDKTSKESLPGASIIEKEQMAGTTSGLDGGFNLKLHQGKIHLRVSYLGYNAIDTVVHLNLSAELEFYLEQEFIHLEETEIKADAPSARLGSVEMGMTKLNMKEIAYLPVLFGETDPLKILQLTPGIQSGQEGNTGFYVRGGGVDQNLILYDEAPIYNAGHLMGFYSVFNTDAISHIKLIKSGFSASYGGRISSIIEVNSAEPNDEKWGGSANLGLISSRAMVEGPIVKNKVSALVSVRRTYLGLIVQPLLKPVFNESSSFFSNSTYKFYDVNAVVFARLTAKDRLKISFYAGNDDFGFHKKSSGLNTDMEWGNVVSSATWIHVFSNRFSLDVSGAFTRYNFYLDGGLSGYDLGMHSGVKDFLVNTGVIWIPHPAHQVKAGVEYIDHLFVPNDIDANTGEYDLSFPGLNERYAIESAAFVGDEWEISRRLKVNVGLRYSYFRLTGPYTSYKKDEVGQVSDTIQFKKGEKIAEYLNPEPRFNLRYLLPNNSSLKFSTMYGYQYSHLATSSSVSLPTDIWLPSTKTIRPQKGFQVSGGYFRNLKGNAYETSAELYYKKMENQAEFLNGVINNSIDLNIEENIVFGEAVAYGLEVYVKKNAGKLTGWLSYALARTYRDFDAINEGKIYPAKYDRRHDLSVVATYPLNEKWNVASTFVFSSGSALTIPVGRYIIQGNLVNEYDEINGFRMPAYHRADVSFTRKMKHKRFNSELTFSIYNFYNRENPYYIYFEASGDLDTYKLDIKPKMVSLFPVLPTVSWGFKF